jgi:antirestriction protein ArdC
MDIRQTITDQIIELLEDETNSFREVWAKGAAKGMPKNGKTGEFYSGVNVFLLWQATAAKSYAHNVWMTFKQAQSVGAQVRKGEKAVMCVFFQMMTKGGNKDAAGQVTDATGEGVEFFPMAKPFWVFNVAQMDNVPADMTEAGAVHGEAFSPIEKADQLIAASGATISHMFDGAFYSPTKDLICMPARNRFTSPETYYATTLHELTHWTGHTSRLDRNFSKRFGDDAYAMEELVAELGSAFLVGSLGFIDATIQGHASYLSNWLKVLKSDKTAIFAASKQAGLAFEFLTEKKA